MVDKEWHWVAQLSKACIKIAKILSAASGRIENRMQGFVSWPFRLRLKKQIFTRQTNAQIII